MWRKFKVNLFAFLVTFYNTILSTHETFLWTIILHFIDFTRKYFALFTNNKNEHNKVGNYGGIKIK